MSLTARVDEKPPKYGLPKQRDPLEGLGLSPRGVNNVLTLVGKFEDLIFNQTPQSSPRRFQAEPTPPNPSEKIKPVLVRNLPIHLSQAASSSSAAKSSEGSTRRLTDPLLFEDRSKRTMPRSHTMKFSKAPRSKSHLHIRKRGNRKRMPKSSSTGAVKRKDQIERQQTENYSLDTIRDQQNPRNAFALTNPHKKQVEHWYQCMSEKTAGSIDDSNFKHKSDNYLLILNDEGQLSWKYTKHFHPRQSSASSSEESMSFDEMVQRSELACNLILTIVKDCYRMGFEHIIEKSIVSMSKSGSRLTHTAEAQIELIHLFEMVLKSQTGRVVLSQSKRFEDRLLGFYWQHLFQQFTSQSRAILHFLESCSKAIKIILHAIERSQRHQVNSYKRKSLGGKPAEETSMEEVDRFFDRIRMTSTVAGSNEQEKAAYFQKILTSSKSVGGYNGKHLQSYSSFFSNANQAMIRCLNEVQKIRTDLRRYVAEAPHLKNYRQEIETYLINREYSSATFFAFRHTQHEMKFYLEAFPKMLKSLGLRACPLIRKKEQQENLRKRLLCNLENPIRWNPLQNTISQIAESMPVKSKKKLV